MAAPALHSISLPGPMLKRGFWLYVGRTGDERSPHYSGPYDRFGQHLGRNKNANAPWRNLEKHGLTFDRIDSYDFVFYGPLFSEVEEFKAH